MRKLLVICFLFGALKIFAGAPVFLGSIKSYITNGPTDSYMVLVFSNQVVGAWQVSESFGVVRMDTMLFSDNSARHVRITNGTSSGAIPYLSFDTLVNRGSVIDWNFGNITRWEMVCDSNTFYFVSGSGMFPFIGYGDGGFGAGKTIAYADQASFSTNLAGTNFFFGPVQIAGNGSTPAHALDVTGDAFVSSNQVFTNLVRPFATNGSVNTNLTVNFDQAVEDWYPTNNISLTNFSGLDANRSKSIVRFITPQLVNRTVVYPTLGGASFGSYWYTNDNSFMWGTLTSGVTYAISLTTRGTNVHASITKWK